MINFFADTAAGVQERTIQPPPFAYDYCPALRQAYHQLTIRALSVMLFSCTFLLFYSLWFSPSTTIRIGLLILLYVVFARLVVGCLCTYDCMPHLFICLVFSVSYFQDPPKTLHFKLYECTFTLCLHSESNFHTLKSVWPGQIAISCRGNVIGFP